MRILVTGGAGYVGSALVPELLKKGYKVTVLDTFWFWDSVGDYLKAIGAEQGDNLKIVKGDIREKDVVQESLKDVESVIHLACVSNDPSSEIDSDFTHSINYTACIDFINASKAAGVKRFIYASTSSVYGIKEEPHVTEDLPLEPITQYSMLKVEVEHYFLHCLDDNFKGVIIRPSTVCGYSPRTRLDVVVNILTNFAVNKGKIKVFGGEQLRPNIHIKDMVRLYVLLLEIDADKIHKKIYNAGYDNMKVMEIANLVKKVVGNVEIEVVPTDDLRSYHVCSEKIKKEIGFVPEHTVEEAIAGLKKAFENGKLKDLDDDKYYNVKRMQRFLEESS